MYIIMRELSKLNNLKKGRFALVLAALLWGLAGVCVKSISWSPISLIAARSLISLIILFVFKRSIKLDFSLKNILGAVCASATGILYVFSIKLTTAGTAIVLQYVAPILVFLFSVIFKGRKARLIEALITLAVFLGILLSFIDSLDPTRILGNVLGLASGFTFAAQIIIMNDENTNSQDSLILSCIIAFLFALPFLFFDKTVSFDATNLVWVLVLGIFQYGLANVMFSIGIDKVPDVEASLILTIEPIFNPIPVAILCHEKMGFWAIIGAIDVIVFVTLYALLPKIQKNKSAE